MAFFLQSASGVYEILTFISAAQPLPQRMMSQADTPGQTEVASTDTAEMQIAHWKRELKISRRYEL